MNKSVGLYLSISKQLPNFVEWSGLSICGKEDKICRNLTKLLREFNKKRKIYIFHLKLVQVRYSPFLVPESLRIQKPSDGSSLESVAATVSRESNIQDERGRGL